jgi:Uma2 family endonuclease
MGRAANEGSITYELYLQLPDDGKRYEVLDGELVVSPAPSRRHQQLSKRLQYHLYRHVEVDRSLGEVYDAPFDVILSDTNVVQPDLIYVASERLGLFEERGLFGAPDLVVEILSPGTRRRDRGLKKAIYARFGVRELWLVEPDRSEVEVWRLADGAYVLEGRLGPPDTLVSGVVPELRLELAQVFG